MKRRFVLTLPLLVLAVGCSSDDPSRGIPVSSAPAHAADGNASPVHPGADTITATYSGRALYRSTRAPVPDILIEVSTAKADGSPTDDIFGETRTDARGHFTVNSTVPPGQRTVLVAAAVKQEAETSGDRREVGYEIKKRETVLGTLLSPSATTANTLLVEPRRLRPATE